MTPDKIAAIHGRAMVVPRAWSEAEFAGLLAAPGCVLSVHKMGFALGRVLLDEAELLTLAVDPDQQGKGIGRDCLEKFHWDAQEMGALRSILEVAATNDPARGLYLAIGYREDGVRKAYYRTPDGPRIDAILMSKGLNA